MREKNTTPTGERVNGKDFKLRIWTLSSQSITNKLCVLRENSLPF